MLSKVPLCLIIRMLSKNSSDLETSILEFIRNWLTVLLVVMGVDQEDIVLPTVFKKKLTLKDCLCYQI